MNTEQRAEFISGLREIADALEQHPELSITGTGTLSIYPKSYPHETALVSLQAWAKVLRTFERVADNIYMRIQRQIGPLKVMVSVDRNSVCRKVTKTVTQEVWECPESLLSDESEEQVAELHAAY